MDRFVRHSILICLRNSLNPLQICLSELRAPQGQFLKQISTKSMTNLFCPSQPRALQGANCLSKWIVNPWQICPSDPNWISSANQYEIHYKSVRQSSSFSKVSFLSKSTLNPIQICPSELRGLQGKFLKQINTKSMTNLSIRAWGYPESSS